MFALASQPQTPARDWSRLMPIKDAAARLEVSVDTLLNRCKHDLVHRDLAVCDRPPQGGKTQWFVDRAYDPRLADLRYVDRSKEPDLSGYSAKQRKCALARRACVEMLLRLERERAAADAPTLHRLVIEYAGRTHPDLKISSKTLYRWRKTYRDPADMVKLIDARGGDRRSLGSPEAWQIFRNLFLSESRPAVRDVWKSVKLAAKDDGFTWCSYDSCRRQLDRRIPPEEQTRHRDPAGYRSGLMPYIEQDAESYAAGERWVGDHKMLDLLCRFSGNIVRPWATVWMDWRTRKICGWTLSTSPDSTTILSALRRGLLDASNAGGPSSVQIDNGRDFDAWLFHAQTKSQRQHKYKAPIDESLTAGIFNLLSIEPHFALPYNGNGKARLERSFRNYERFARRFPTYTGRDVETKPERLKEILAEPENIPTFEDVYQRFGEFITGLNLEADHAIDDLTENGVALSPAEAFARWCDSKRVFADPTALDLLMQHWHKPVYVTRNGISIAIRGRTFSYGQFAPELKPFKAMKKDRRVPVNVSFDIDNVDSIRVYTQDWRYVCTASMNKLGGAHGTKLAMDHVKELNRQRNRYIKAKRVVDAESITSILTNEEHLAKIAVDQDNKPTPPTPAPSMRMVQTPLDGQSKAVQMGEFRQAAGGEIAGPFVRQPLVRPSSLIPSPQARDRRDDEPLSGDALSILRRKHGTR